MMELTVSDLLYVLIIGLWLTVRLMLQKLIGVVSVGLVFVVLGAMYLYAFVVLRVRALFERARSFS